MRFTGTSSTLPDSVRGTSIDLQDLVGDVPRRAVLADAPLDLGDQIVAQHGALAQHHEQQHAQLAIAVRRGNVHDERVQHLIHPAAAR